VDGVQEEQTIDSGNEEIRSGQGEIKFNSLANKIGEAGGKNAVYCAVALAEEEQKGGADHNATDDEDDEESNSSSDESEHGRVFSFAGAAPAGDGSQSNTTHNVQSTSARGARANQRQTPPRPGAKRRATPNANATPPHGRNSTIPRTSPKTPEKVDRPDSDGGDTDNELASIDFPAIMNKMTKLQASIKTLNSGMPTSGWLSKQPGRRTGPSWTGWKRRWFVLTPASEAGGEPPLPLTV